MFVTEAMLQVGSGSLTSGVAEGAIQVRRVDSATTGSRASGVVLCRKVPYDLVTLLERAQGLGRSILKPSMTLF
jgi:hypothetical protein